MCGIWILICICNWICNWICIWIWICNVISICICWNCDAGPHTIMPLPTANLPASCPIQCLVFVFVFVFEFVFVSLCLLLDCWSCDAGPRTIMPLLTANPPASCPILMCYHCTTDSYFHDLVFVFVSFITNIKAVNMKNPAGKSAPESKKDKQEAW